jgi:hypothetical protein
VKKLRDNSARATVVSMVGESDMNDSDEAQYLACGFLLAELGMTNTKQNIALIKSACEKTRKLLRQKKKERLQQN